MYIYIYMQVLAYICVYSDSCFLRLFCAFSICVCMYVYRYVCMHLCVCLCLCSWHVYVSTLMADFWFLLSLCTFSINFCVYMLCVCIIVCMYVCMSDVYIWLFTRVCECVYRICEFSCIHVYVPARKHIYAWMPRYTCMHV